MKKVFSNKDFLPKKLIKQMNERENSNNKRVIYWLIIIFILLLPIAINSIDTNSNKESKIDRISIDENTSKFLSVESIKLWLDEFGEEESGEFDSSKGEIIINCKESILELLSQEEFEVINIEALDNGRYKVMVGIN